MSQKKFKYFFLDNILDFLWRQWSALGVAGGAYSEDKWVIDPEALIIFSIELTRYEPRLFDEILDWLVINGKWIDIQRLRGILKTEEKNMQRLMSAVASFLSNEVSSHRRKWEALSFFEKPGVITHKEMLFKLKKDLPFPEPLKQSIIFQEYSFIREGFSLQKMSKPVNVATSSNIRFLLRSLFGIGSRSECILYLLTHEAGHPSEVAGAVGISVRGIQDALIELAQSGLILTRIRGKRKIEYWLSQKRWWEFLVIKNFEEIKPPVWLDWIALFSALKSVWDVINKVEILESDYMRSSKLRESMKTISNVFVKSGLDLPAFPGGNIKPDHYEKEFQSFMTNVLGARVETNR